MYKCLECGHIFDRGEERIVQECRGEYWGHVVYEDVAECPHCGGVFDETVRCVKCYSEHLEDELWCGVCEECIKEEAFKYVWEMTKDQTESVNISSLVASLFDEEQINNMLFEYVMGHYPNIDCEDYVKLNMLELGEAIAKEVKKNENEKKQSQ